MGLPTLITHMSEETEQVEQEDEKTIHIFVTVRHGSVVSILSNKPDMDIDVIDEDLADIDDEIAESNTHIETKQTEMFDKCDMYEYLTQEEDETKEES